jgi:hypothetical protein
MLHGMGEAAAVTIVMTAMSVLVGDGRGMWGIPRVHWYMTADSRQSRYQRPCAFADVDQTPV